MTTWEELAELQAEIELSSESYPLRLLRQISHIACLKLAEKDDELGEAYAELDNILLKQAPEGESRFVRLVNDAPDQDLFLALLELCVAQSWNREVAKNLPAGVSLEYAANYSETAPAGMGGLREFYRYACRYLKPVPSALPFFHQPFVADERLLTYLCGGNTLDPLLAKEGARLLDSPPRHPFFTRKELLERLNEILTDPYGPPVIQLAGDKGSGRTFLLHYAHQAQKMPLLVVDYQRLAGKTREDAALTGGLIAREARLSSAGVCFSNITRKSCPDEAAILLLQELYLHPLEELGRPVCLTTDPDTELIPFLDSHVEKLVLPEPSRGERIALWQGFCGLYGLSGQVDCLDAGAKFRLSPLQIGKAAQQLSRRKQEGTIGEEEVSAACAQVLPPPRQGSIRLVNTTYTLDDIKVPDEIKEKLRHVCAHVRYSRRVYDEWGMESRYAYGKNVSALLVGPPGTGKTMAAHVLSNELNIPLYRIDLSQVVDKYIGETEKRLEEIFQSAERSNTILFFDEADAIFGKRSEVNDAHDKYANTEVSYILQRIEQYDGIVILATNYKKNIDEAFMRRMRYLIEFAMPAQEERLQIWQSSFSDQVPLDRVDCAFLARQFELSGGSIKNIALNAAFLAAEENTAVTMRHILDSLRGENLKVGKPMLKQDFAEYGKIYDELKKS